MLDIEVELARGDDDALPDIAIAQHLARHLAAHFLAIAGIVETLECQLVGQLLETDILPLGNVPQRGGELLEIVRGLETSSDTIARAQELASGLGKTAILVRDTPGFASSRLGVILGAEAMRMLETGVASAHDIDRAMELGYRHPMGPLKLTDLVGLDVRLSILEHLQREIGEQFRPPGILRMMVRAGKLGKKAGEGFYVWKDGVAQ